MIFSLYSIMVSHFPLSNSIIFNRIPTSKLPILLFYLKDLPELQSLSIRLEDCHGDIGYIYQMIFDIYLKYFSNINTRISKISYNYANSSTKTIYHHRIFDYLS